MDVFQKLGEDHIEVYVSLFTPLEWKMPSTRMKERCFAKFITNRDTGEIIGFHILSPNAGEITQVCAVSLRLIRQGYGLAMKTHATYQDLMNVVGIHPTIAEEFTTMTVTKRSGANAKKGGC